MKNRHYEKTYGISPVVLSRPRKIAGKQRYCIIADGQRLINLNYARPETALQKAENFIRQAHKNFTDFQGFNVTFSFRQI